MTDEQMVHDRPGIFQFFKKIAKSELYLQRLFNI